ncbi:MAG: glycosyltransferase family 4 protein [Telluria sp.]
MRILHLLDHSLPRRSGYALHAHALLGAQRARGWQTVQLTGPAQGPARGRESPPADWHYYRTRGGAAWLAVLPPLRRLADQARLHARVRELVRLSRPNILHAHAAPQLGLAGLLAARRGGLPFVYEARGAPGRPGGVLEGQVARQADGLVAATAWTLSCLRRRDERQACCVMPGALDHVPSPRRRQHAGPPVLLYVGALAGGPGLDILLATLPALAARLGQLHVVLADPGPLSAGLRERLAVPVALCRLDCFPGLDPEQLPRWYRAADLVVFPRPLGDPSCGSQRVLEAMAHGCAVAATDIPGHRDLVQHGRTGLLFDPGSVAALSSCLQAFLPARDCLAALGAAARDFVATQRTWEASMASYASMYSQLLHRPV